MNKKSIFKATFVMAFMATSFVFGQSGDQQQNYNGSYNYPNRVAEQNYQHNPTLRYFGNTPEAPPFGADWEYDEGWRNDRDAYLRGDTQPQAFRKAHPYGPAGIGYDADPEYLRMEQAYRQNHPNPPQRQGGYYQDQQTRNQDYYQSNP